MAPKRKRGHNLERWEVALVKAMLSRGGYSDQDILAYFTRPTRSINHRVIAEIRREKKHRLLAAASAAELDTFLASWPELDPSTGLSLRGDELVIKAREAMIAAVHVFNSVGLTFRAELFVVTAIIAWTYLFHSFFKRNGIDFRHFRNIQGKRQVEKTKFGADKYWELGKCIRHIRSPLTAGEVNNLDFILQLRHEIEHRSTERIDDTVSAKLQACCINFNNFIKSHFGERYSLEHRLPIALQLATFGAEQRAVLKAGASLPKNIEMMIQGFESHLSAAEQADPRFAYRAFFVAKTAGRISGADVAVEFIKSGSTEETEVNRILLKEVEKPKYKPKQIIKTMRREGFSRFTMQDHTELWRKLEAKNPGKGYGITLSDGQWYWYENWIGVVRQHCVENSDTYVARTQPQA